MNKQEFISILKNYQKKGFTMIETHIAIKDFEQIENEIPEQEINPFKSTSNELRLRRYNLQKDRRERLGLKGLCRVCGKNKARENKTSCISCGNAQKLLSRRNRLKLKRANICDRCGVDPITVGRSCASCANIRKMKQEAKKLSAIKNQSCMLCGESVKTGSSKCQKCLNLARDKMRLNRENKKKLGICYNCDKKSMKKGIRCEYHAKEHAKKMAKYRAKKCPEILNCPVKQNVSVVGM